MRQAGIERRWPGRREQHDLLDSGEISVAVKRPLAGKQLVQQNSGGKNVGACIDGAALNLLRRHVLERSDHRPLRARGVTGVLDAGHTEICELDATTGFNQQVGRFDVAVHDALLVRVLQRRQQVGHDGQRLPQCVQLALVKVVLQVVALDELHHQKGDVTVSIRVVHADDIGVLQAGRRTRFCAKAHFVVCSGFF